ncbi:MAG: ATP-dependent helicase, partial [Fimbriimonadaceae bacterium]
MIHRIAISPQGSLGLVATTSEIGSLVQSIEIAPEIVGAFEASLVGGLATLASSRWQSAVMGWPAEFAFWRDYARSYFAALCRQSSSTSKQWSSIGPPDTTTLEEWLQLAPPMPGLEYLNPGHLQVLWNDLDAYTRDSASGNEEGLAGLLRSLDENWNLIGRVTFHLAENKKNPDAPFAFLATYTQGQAKDGNPQHLPLADALRESIAAKDTAKLDQLLEPVSRAARSVKLVAHLLETRKLFAPQAWGIGQAYEF